jgi:hypothetical protein
LPLPKADPIQLAVGRFQQILLGLFGAVIVVIAMAHVALGPAAIPGGLPGNATMDSEDRFYAVFFLAYGAGVLWCTRDVERKSGLVYFLAATFFVGGLARLVSMARVGPPHVFFVVMTALELALPIAFVLIQRRLDGTTKVRRQTN